MTLKEIIFTCVRAIIHFMAMFVCLAIGTVVGLFSREAASSIFFHWVEFFKKLYGIRVHVQNNNDPSISLNGCVFVLLNQTSLLDGPLGAIAIPRPRKGIVNIEYALIPFFGWVMGMTNFVIVRQWGAQAKNVLTKVEKFLTNKGNIWMSIEGRRSRSGALSKYKKGPVVMAIRSQARIVPVIMSGASDILGYGMWRIRSGDVVVRLLNAIDTKGLEYEDRDVLVKQLHAIAEKELLLPIARPDQTGVMP